MHVLVPSGGMPSGRSALRSLLAGAERLDAAVAFVTATGVQVLRDLFDEVGMPAEFRIVVRGGPISDPDAVLTLADLGAEVRVVMGAEASRFHPKLWIAATAGWSRVLSGSGNLTAGGLDGNHEQFELLSLKLPGRYSEAAEHGERWSSFFALGSPLAEAVTSPGWTEWIAQQNQRRRLETQLEKLDRRLVDSSVHLSAGEGLPWLKSLLQEAVPSRYAAEISRPSWGERVQIDAGDSRGVRYVFLSYGGPHDGSVSPAINLEIFPGDTLGQARKLYGRMDERMQQRVLRLNETPGWFVRSNFHVGFRDRGLIYDDGGSVSLADYLEHWRSCVHDKQQFAAADWPALLKTLVSARVVSSGYPNRFSEEIGRRSQVNSRPGLQITRTWPIREVERMARRGKLVDSVTRAINEVFAAIGEPPLDSDAAVATGVR